MEIGNRMGPMRMGLGFCALGAILLLCGCSPAPERTEALEAIARWEDLRLAETDSLTTMMRSPDAHIRRAAMRAAGLIGRSDILVELTGGLDDRSESVAIEAATALGFLGDREASAAVIAKLAGAGPNLRRAILFALGQLPNDGVALAAYALGAERAESDLAWDALRNQVAEIDSTLLRDTIGAGLLASSTVTRWRVLRCAERSGATALVPQIAPFTTAADIQAAVHACRALGNLAADDPTLRIEAIEALQLGWSHSRESLRNDRDRMRLRVAVLRALARLAGPLLESDDQPAGDSTPTPRSIATLLIAGIRDPNTHVRRTALETTATLIGPLRLPPEAIARESLLPVWRIRLLQAAAAGLMPIRDGDPMPANAPEPIIRAAAARACCALRGAGIETDDLWPALLKDRHPLVQSAMADGMAAYCLDPETLLLWSASLGEQTPPHLQLAAADALLAAWGRFSGETHPPSTIQRVRLEIERVLDVFARGEGAPAANAAALLGEFPSEETLDRLCRIHDAAQDTPAGVDIRLGVLAAVENFGTTDAFSPSDSLRSRLGRILEAGFDAPTANLRLAARRAAIAGQWLSQSAIPGEASLRATLPAVRRSPDQAPLTLPFDAPRVRCITARGEFVMQLDGRHAPNTCATILALIREGFYENLSFHRVVPDFVIQGGCPDGNGWGSPGFTIRSEWSRLPYERGAVGIAHSGKDTGGSQFFVTLSAQPHLNGRYTVFGNVVSGMKVAETIQPDDTFRLVIED